MLDCFLMRHAQGMIRIFAKALAYPFQLREKDTQVLQNI